jgi:hypothetical protein
MKDENESNGDSNLIIVEPYLKNDESISDNLSFTLDMKNIPYKISLSRTKNNIFFTYQNYELKLNLNEFKYTNILFNVCRNIDDIFKLLVTVFNRKKVKIKEIKENQMITLELTLKNYIDDEEQTMNLILLYKNQNKDFLINDIYNKYNLLQNEMDKMKNDYIRMNNKLNKTIYEINKLKEEISQNNSNENRPSLGSSTNSTKLFDAEPTNLNSVYNLVSDSYNIDYLDNTFILFSTKNDCLYLVYATELKSIKCYSFGHQKLIKEIKNAHDDYITNFRYCFNKKNEKDMIMSISGWINNIKIWDGNTWQCLLNISNVNNNGYLFSSAFLVIKNFNNMNYNKLLDEYYIISSNRNHLGTSEPIKVYDLNGKLISKILESNDNTCFIDTYCEKEKKGNKENLKYYIITGNTGYVKSYDYFNKKLYKIYHEKDNKADHLCVLIKKIDENIKLIESCADGFIRIWGYHDGDLNGKVDCKVGLLGICIWNSNYLFTGSKDNSIKLIDIKNLKIVKSLNGHNNYVCTIRKIVHPKYGGCIISQSWHNDDIKIWMNNE